MSVHHAWAVTSSVSPEAWEPYPIDDVEEGDPQGEVAFLRSEDDGERMLHVGLFRGQPSRFRYVYAGNESVHLLAGRVTITAESGEAVELVPGSLAVFAKGTRAVWEIHEPSMKFFVISS